MAKKTRTAKSRRSKPAKAPRHSGGSLGDLIGSAEGGKAGYNAFNRGSSDSAGTVNFSRLSVADIMARQSLPKDDARRLFAVGKYQLIPATLKEAVQKLSLKQSGKFTPGVQEHIFRNYLIGAKRSKVKEYITGKADDLASAQIALAMEFASVARPDTGQSNFGGVVGGAARISAEQTARALEAERKAYQAAQEKAWNRLSRGI